eukprot:XP_003968721.1 PREDICTED: transcription regulator protein BACH1 [Takifugu rubripes]
MAVFTFQSAGHCVHLLQCLNDQRQQDVLCDVTIEVGNATFRAHRSVLASCSDYFHHRVTSVTSHNATITLSEEVTVEGFEPLLQFAYTSKLTFTKENIHAICKSAEFLGFNNLESACFDFLIPKFSEGREKSQEVRRRPCCHNLASRTNVDYSVESSQPKSSGSSNSVPSRDEEHTDFPSQCPQSTPDQFKSREEHLSLETCGPQMATLSLELSGSDMYPVLPLASHDVNKADHSAPFCERALLEIGDVCNQSELSLADCDLSCDLSPSEDMNPSELESESSDVKQTVETLGAETTYNSGPCLADTSGAGTCSGPLGQNEVDVEQRIKGEHSEPTIGAGRHKDRLVERSSVEREVAEHLAKGFWSDSRPPQAHALALEPTDQSNLDKASDFHWLKQLDLSSSVGDCPFLKDLETNDDPVSRAESLSHSEKSPCMSSLNSGDDSELDTDGDAEANKKRAEEIQLPFPVEQISVLTRSAFQQLLKHNHLTHDQLEFVHDVRRRSKNRVAAQRCRKRKLEGIHQLQCEIKRLTSEKEHLLREQTELERNLEQIRYSLCEFCKTVSVESASDQDHLQSLTQLSQSTSSNGLVGKYEATQLSNVTLDSSACDLSKLPAASNETGVSEAEPQTEESVSEQSCPDPMSLLKDCLDMDNIL